MKQLRNKEVHCFYSSPDILGNEIKWDEKSSTCGQHSGEQKKRTFGFSGETSNKDVQLYSMLT